MRPKGTTSIAQVAQFVAGVGEGNIFTKSELTAAVPGFAQSPRRMRDLREMGWVIDNYKTSSSLRPDQYFLRKIGTRIDLGEPRPTTERKTISRAKRRRILERDGHTCQVCGATAGLEHPDDHGKNVVLTVRQIIDIQMGGTDDDENLRAECTVCAHQVRAAILSPQNAHGVLALAQVLGNRKDKQRLYRWMSAGRRLPDDTERVYNEWARLSQAQRDEVRTELGRQLGEA